MKITYFQGIENLSDLKTKYRQLVKVHHPDCGGNGETIKIINNEYEYLFNTNEWEKQTGQDPAETSSDFINIINDLIKYDLIIEVCGSWLWVYNPDSYEGQTTELQPTFQAKEILKQHNFQWANKKCKWYLGKRESASRGKTTMEQIREKYGSDIHRQTKAEQKKSSKHTTVANAEHKNSGVGGSQPHCNIALKIKKWRFFIMKTAQDFKFYGFLDNKKALQNGKISAVLSKVFNYGTVEFEDNKKTLVGVKSRADRIIWGVQNGYTTEYYERQATKKIISYNNACHAPSREWEEYTEKGYSLKRPIFENGKVKFNSEWQITKTEHDFALFLQSAGLTTAVAIEAFQFLFDIEQNKKQQAEQAETEKQAKEQADHLEQLKQHESWLNEATTNYNDTEKIEIQKAIFLDIMGTYHPRAIEFLVQIENINNPLNRADIISRLHNDNKASLKTFEHITGVKLATGHKERMKQLETITTSDYAEQPRQYTPRAKATPSEYKETFYISQRNNKKRIIEYVEARGLKYTYKSFTFFIQKSEQGSHRATEGTTGLLISSVVDTLEAVKKEINNQVDKLTIDGLNELLNSHITANGISPLYAEQQAI